MPEFQPQLRTIGELADTNPEALGVGADPRAHFKYVDLSSVTSGTVAWNSAPEVTLLTAPSRARRVLRRGDVLFGTVRPSLQSHGYVDWAGNGALIGSTGFSVIRAKAGVSDPRYLFHCIMSSGVTAQANRDAVGSSYPALNDSDVRRFEVFAPPVGEQVAVAQVLDTLDTTIRQTEAFIEKLKHVKQGLLHDLLTRGIDANGELRPPQSQAPHLYKDSPLGWIPREWALLPIGSLASEVTSGARDWARFYADTGAAFVRIGNLTREHINFRLESLVFVRPPAAGEGQRTKLQAGDILISITADLGIVGVVPETLGEAYINQHIAMVRVDQERANPRFLGHFLSGHAAQRHIAKLNDSGAKAGLNLPTIRGLPMAAPTPREQEDIAKQLDGVDLRVAAAKIELSKMAMLKAGLMDDLLSGRVRVTPLMT